VLAVPDASSYQRAEDLAGRTIATELVQATTAYFRRRTSRSTWSSRGARPKSSLPISRTPSSKSPKRARRCAPTGSAIIDTVLESNTQLIGNAASLEDEWKRTKIDNLSLLLRAAIEAHARVGLMLNVRCGDLDRILGLLPALQRPTVSPLSDRQWVAVNTIVDEHTVRS
jgi:ATP phosphoribosyltransferase